MIVLLAALNIVTTTPDLAALARDLAGPDATVRSLCRVNEDPHFVEPKPSHILALNQADLLIEVGLELEAGWLPALLSQTRNPKLRTGRLVAGSVITPLDVPVGPVDRSQGDVHALGNPHFLLDPEQAKQVARLIADRLPQRDPAALLQRIDAASRDAEAMLAPYRGTKIVTYHRSLSYLADRYGFVVVNTIEPKPGIPPSLAHITALTAQMKAENVRLILREPWHDRRVPNLIAGKTGARVVELPVFGDDYPATVRAIAGQIAEGLK
jgi:ABC-type Zn uptake system ZnuABC Zn-binding protein ZnuA